MVLAVLLNLDFPGAFSLSTCIMVPAPPLALPITSDSTTRLQSETKFLHVKMATTCSMLKLCSYKSFEVCPNASCVRIDRSSGLGRRVLRSSGLGRCVFRRERCHIVVFLLELVIGGGSACCSRIGEYPDLEGVRVADGALEGRIHELRHGPVQAAAAEVPGRQRQVDNVSEEARTGEESCE